MVERTYPLLRHFDDYVLSHRVRALKPSLRIYREAIARAGCEPHECFFTDDIPAYVEGARAAGMDAVQFLSCGQLEGELRARSIQWG
jgi:HAD superfamily hydrolase (TIGR01509 family)